VLPHGQGAVVASVLNRSSFAQRSTPHQASRHSGNSLASAPPEHSRPTLTLSREGALPSEDDSLMTDGMDRFPGGSPMQLKRVTREAQNRRDGSREEVSHRGSSLAHARKSHIAGVHPLTSLTRSSSLPSAPPKSPPSLLGTRASRFSCC
jgi:hypothetical protein